MVGLPMYINLLLRSSSPGQVILNDGLAHESVQDLLLFHSVGGRHPFQLTLAQTEDALAPEDVLPRGLNREDFHLVLALQIVALQNYVYSEKKREKNPSKFNFP